jgi:hypothetical protein
LFSLNIVIPIIFSVFNVAWTEAWNNVTKYQSNSYAPSVFIDSGATITYMMIIGLQVVSGIYLANSLRLVKSYFDQGGQTENLNTRALVLHVATFGLYLATVCIFLVAVCLVNFNLLHETSTVFIVIAYFYLYAGMIAEALLVVVLWQIATLFKATNQRNENQDSATLAEVHVVSWDDEAQLQTAIWNKFVRGNTEEAAALSLGAQSFAAAQITTQTSTCNS